MKNLTGVCIRDKALWWIFWFCKQNEHFCFQNYAVGHGFWTWKKIFSSEWRNISASHFVNVWVRGFLGHLLGYSTCFSNYFSANYSLTFATPRTWKNTYYFPRRNGAYELKTNFCPFSPTFELCRTHTCLLGPRVFSNKWLTIYDAKPAAPALSVKLLIFGKKSYLRVKKNSAFVFYFWGWEAWSSFHVGSIE